MTAKAYFRMAGECRAVEVCGQTALDALRSSGIDFAAPCGGKGICGKCRVLLREGDEFRPVLACRLQLADGMEFLVEPRQGMNIRSGGAMGDFPAEGNRSGFGCAIDIGTTTLVCRLHDMASGLLLASSSRINPQVVFGADVISRISACREGHLDEMYDSLRAVLSEMVETLCCEVKLARGRISYFVVVGNTVMEHLAAGFSPESIGVAPYEPLSRFGKHLHFVPVGNTAYFAPALSGYVGGDILAGMAASGLPEAAEVQIYLDLGTNGELAIGNRDAIICCATAAGPVFEGAGIRCGMPAQRGAVSSVCLEDGVLDLRVIGGGEPVGICGTGLIEAAAALLDAGLVDETGRLLDSDEVAGFWKVHFGERDGKKAFLLDTAGSVYLTQEDIRNLQLAKAAICAGIRVLLEAYGSEGVAFDSANTCELIVAGGFGSSLNLNAAARIGLFPRELLARARNIGNAAVDGASMILVSDEARETVEELARTCCYLELSTDPRFSEHFMNEMYFPSSPSLPNSSASPSFP